MRFWGYNILSIYTLTLWGLTIGIHNTDTLFPESKSKYLFSKSK